MNSGFTNLHINGAVSPYAGSTNASQSSIAVSLQRERGINSTTNGIRNSRASSNMGPMSPLSPLPGESRQQYSTRTAPIISANPMKEVYNADQPTAGQPYAFPDPDISNRSSGSGEDPRSGSTMSRRNSEHASISSSIFTSDSRMPAGQHRLDEGRALGSHTVHSGADNDPCRCSWNSPPFPSAQASQPPCRRVRISRCSFTIQPHTGPPSKPQTGGAQATH